MYTNINYKWCKQCQINYLRKNFISWTSENEKIDNFIQKKQLEINNSSNILFEWIPYDQFYDIKEIDKGGFSVVYSAKWKDGPLYYNFNKKKYVRFSNKKVALKYLHKLQNIDVFFNKV